MLFCPLPHISILICIGPKGRNIIAIFKWSFHLCHMVCFWTVSLCWVESWNGRITTANDIGGRKDGFHTGFSQVGTRSVRSRSPGRPSCLLPPMRENSVPVCPSQNVSGVSILVTSVPALLPSLGGLGHLSKPTSLFCTNSNLTSALIP